MFHLKKSLPGTFLSINVITGFFVKKTKNTRSCRNIDLEQDNKDEEVKSAGGK